MCFDVLNRKTHSYLCAFSMKTRVKPKLFSLKLKIKMEQNAHKTISPKFLKPYIIDNTCLWVYLCKIVSCFVMIRLMKVKNSRFCAKKWSVFLYVCANNCNFASQLVTKRNQLGKKS